MSEQNKTVELNDEELKEVSGGITVEEYNKNPVVNRPYVKLKIMSGGAMSIGSCIRRIVDGLWFTNTGFNNGIDGSQKYTDYFFYESNNPNNKLVIRAYDVDNGFFNLSEYQ